MDIFSNQEQLRLLLQSLLLGVGTGLLYDILRALRRHFRKPRQYGGKKNKKTLDKYAGTGLR